MRSDLKQRASYAYQDMYSDHAVLCVNVLVGFLHSGTQNRKFLMPVTRLS